jgi:hypothetical protein
LLLIEQFNITITLSAPTNPPDPEPSVDDPAALTGAVTGSKAILPDTSDYMPVAGNPVNVED